MKNRGSSKNNVFCSEISKCTNSRFKRVFRKFSESLIFLRRVFRAEIPVTDKLISELKQITKKRELHNKTDNVDNFFVRFKYFLFPFTINIIFLIKIQVMFHKKCLY